MMPRLLYKDREFAQTKGIEHELVHDLQLDPLLNVMSKGDTYLYDTAKQVLLHSETDIELLRYRQDITADAMHNPLPFKNMYAIAKEISDQSVAYRNHMKPNFARTVWVREKLKTAVQLLSVMLDKLKELRDIGKSNRHHFTSTRLAEFYMELDDKYSDTFFLDAGKHLRGLKKAV